MFTSAGDGLDEIQRGTCDLQSRTVWWVFWRSSHLRRYKSVPLQELVTVFESLPLRQRTIRRCSGKTLLADDDGQARGANLYLVNFFR
jgi:hypothetical protein